MTCVQTIAERIQWILDHRDMSQRGLSDKAGFSSKSQLGNTLRRLAARPESIEVETVRAIAEGAGVSLEWLLTGRGMPDDPAELPQSEGRADYHVVPDGEALSVPILRNYPNWTELVESAKALDPKIPDWPYESLGQRSPFLTGPLHPAAVRDLARVVMKYESPPAKTASVEPPKKTKRVAK